MQGQIEKLESDLGLGRGLVHVGALCASGPWAHFTFWAVLMRK
jgi:hypothetical protein